MAAAMLSGALTRLTLSRAELRPATCSHPPLQVTPPAFASLRSSLGTAGYGVLVSAWYAAVDDCDTLPPLPPLPPFPEQGAVSLLLSCAHVSPATGDQATQLAWRRNGISAAQRLTTAKPLLQVSCEPSRGVCHCIHAGEESNNAVLDTTHSHVITACLRVLALNFRSLAIHRPEADLLQAERADAEVVTCKLKLKTRKVRTALAM